MITPQQTEKEFNNFFEQNGYSRVEDDLVKNPELANADYVNRNERIIVELKVLDKEQFPEGGIIDSMQAIIMKPKQINLDGNGIYSFTIPNMNREGKFDNIEEPLRRSLKKANKQLKETKNFYFNDSPSSGFIMLAQTGMTSLSPEIIAQVVKKILNNEFSSIDGVIVCTPHYQLINPVTRKMNEVCVSVTKDVFPKLRDQCMRIADQWVEFYSNNGHARNG